MIYFYENGNRLFDDKFKKIEITDIPRIITQLSSEKRLCIDTETSGLNPLKDKVIMLQIGDGKDQYVFDTRGLNVEKYFKPLLEREDIMFVGHNIKFDYNMLKQFNIFMRNVNCTYINEMVICNDKYDPVFRKAVKRFSLKFLAKRYLGVVMDKEVQTEFSSWGHMPFTESQIKYGAFDVELPIKILDKQQYYINKLETQKTNNLESQSLLAIGDIEYNGFLVNTEKWLDAYRAHHKKLQEAIVEIDEIVIKDHPSLRVPGVQLSLFDSHTPQRNTNVNWNSSSQVTDILNRYDIKPLDKDGKASTGTPALKSIYDAPPIIKSLLKIREHSKAVSSFGKKFLDKHQHPDGRLRSSYTQIVGTGRMSSSNPNLQQIPSGKEYRHAFEAPEGSVYITADYKNQEGVIMADMSGDEEYIRIFKKGGDVHSMIATTLFSAAEGKHVEVNNDEDHPNHHLRKKGKILNFMISFGGSAYSLSKTLNIEEKEAQKLIDAFYKGFKRLKPFFNNSIQTSLRKGFIRANNVSGRVRWLQGWDKYNELRSVPYEERTREQNSELASLKGRMGRKAQNTKIQGTAGDITKTALILIRKRLLKLGIEPKLDADIKIVQVVHDEIVIEAVEGRAQEAAGILESCMIEAGTYFLKTIKLEAQPHIGKTWKH